MLTLASILLTLVASGVAAAAAVRLRLPGGAIIWALVAAAALHIASPDLGPLPAQFRTAAMILVGIVLGTTITRSPLRSLWTVRWAVLVCTAALVAGSAGVGWLLAVQTPLDVPTAMFGVAPGGANDMAAASLHFGLDAVLVAGFQVIRQLIVFVVVPVLLSRLPPSSGSPSGSPSDPGPG